MSKRKSTGASDNKLSKKSKTGAAQATLFKYFKPGQEGSSQATTSDTV